MDSRLRLRRAAKRYRDAKAEREAAIRQAAEDGISRREIGREVGLTGGRIQQILDEKRTAA